jgi:hypothetical protein
MKKEFSAFAGLTASLLLFTTSSHASTCQGHPECEGLNPKAGNVRIEMIEMECTREYAPTGKLFYATGPKWTANKRALEACTAYATEQGGSEKDCLSKGCYPVEYPL